MQLHWLPTTARIDFKVLTKVYKCLHGKAPKCLQDLLHHNMGANKGLRSESLMDLLITSWVKNKTFANRSFSVYAPRLWNRLLNYIRASSTPDSFKSNLKNPHIQRTL